MRVERGSGCERGYEISRYVAAGAGSGERQWMDGLLAVGMMIVMDEG